MIVVVSDTSPVLNLSRIGRLDLLHSLYQQVLIPEAVYAELADSTGETTSDVKNATKERQADLLLVDERQGRRIAMLLGLKVTGLLGVLTEAKRAGFISAAKPILDQLMSHARFWIGDNLYREFLSALNES